MPSLRINALDKHLTAVAVPALALFIIAGLLGLFSLQIDPWLQQIAPIESWPLTAKVLHWISPWFAVSAGFTAAGLLTGVLDGVWLRYFTHRKVVSVSLAWALIVLAVTAWASFPLALQLLGGKI